MSAIIRLSFCFAQSLIEKEEELISKLPFGADEQNRLRNIKNSASRLESLAALIALNNILPPALENTEIVRSKNGKPSFSSAPLFFSLSHSNGLAFAALSDEPIGLDLEFIDSSRAFLKIAERFFSTEEYEKIANSSRQDFDFFSLWTKYEAMAKMSGRGLSEICSSPLSSSLFFKQFELKNGGDTAILSICTKNSFECPEIYDPYKELIFYELQN